MKKGFLIAMLITVVGFILAGWFILTTEGEVPINWNMQGEVDRYGSPCWILVFPAVSLFTTVLMYFIPKIDPKGDNIKNSGPVLPVTMVLVSALMLGIQTFIIMATNGADIFNMTAFIFGAIGLLLIAIGYYTPKIKQNYMMGIRTPWTLASEEVWTKTHKASGKWLIASGVVFLASMFLNMTLALIISLTFVITVMLGLVVYSYVLYAQEKKG